jgi:3-carboxy-cis,cis-muconate cycloisomerase
VTSLFWPGDARAGDLFTDRAFREAMVVVEAAWIGESLAVPDVELDTEHGGNPVIPLVEALRSMHPELDLHSGLTSQDVVDSALMLLLRDAVTMTRGHLARALVALVRLTEEHGTSPMIGRTLTQWALPITFGDKVAGWRAGLEEALADLASLTFPVQVGGPVGTSAGAPLLAERLGLDAVPSWHTHRRPITRAGDALVTTTDACGRLARDVLELSRPEIGELSEGLGGRSSSMPHKANPVLSVLVRRAALTTPLLAATLHLCAADQVDERADGAWHAEWDTLRILVRRTAVAASQTADLVEGLRVHPDRMAVHLAAAEDAR